MSVFKETGFKLSLVKDKEFHHINPLRGKDRVLTPIYESPLPPIK